MTAELHRRPNRLEINTASVVRRVGQIRQRVGDDLKVFAALKADGYGFGTLAMARAALEGGADALSLIDRGQALALREAGVEAPILVYAGAPIDEAAVAAAARHKLILTVLGDAQIETVERHARGPVELAIKVEVGPERIGVLPTQLLEMAGRIARAPHLSLSVVNAHPTFRVEAPDSVVLEQFNRFVAATDRLAGVGSTMPTRLFASSKVLGRLSGLELDAVDPGQYLYADRFDLPIIHCLTSRLLQVRDVTRDFAPEHAPFDVTKVRRIGVIPFGRVDGGGRCHGPAVLVRGRRAAILGPPSLEYIRIDLSLIPDAADGDEVVLIGRQGEAAITLDEICTHQNAMPSDIAMTIGPAVMRTWHTTTSRPA